MSQTGILLARQPIFDEGMEVAAYELLHRSMNPEAAVITDGNEASARVLLTAFGNVGISALTQGKPAFINFTEHLVINPPPLDPAHLVVELLEDVEPTPTLVAGLQRLRERGFRIALDDFEHRPGLEALIELADIVKLDVLGLGEARLRAEVRRLRNYPVKLLAEKIESWEVFNHCLDLGCALFQGYFLARPQAVHGKHVVIGRHALLGLMAEIARPDAAPAVLAATIATDPVLGFNLIRFVNSPMYRRATPVESLREAILHLGTERVRSWCYLLLMARVDGKPRELTRLALARARFCELLGAHTGEAGAARCFVMGMLSALDAFFDQPLADLLGNLPLSEDLLAALLGHHGTLGALLESAIAFETGDFDRVPWAALAAAGVDTETVERDYLDSTRWVDEVLSAMPSAPSA
jgi:EAL and modified HD-GYP domain-containing signal transduction protein